MSITRLRRKMQRSIRWIMLFFAVVFAVTAIFAFSPAMVSQLGAGGPEPVMARVNGEPIHRRDFEVRLAQQQEQIQTLPITLAFHFTRMTWQGMVDDVLRQQGAQKLGVRISDDDVQRAVRERIEQFIQLRAADASPSDKEELRQNLRNAVPFRRETVRQELLQQRLAEVLSERARPVEIRVAHVLVSTDQRRPEQAYDIARSIAQQARTGRDFAQLARERSDDPGSKQQGGDVGWVKPDSSFVPEFIGAAFRLRVNEISDPVRSRYGYHVIKVLEERPWKPTEPGSDKWDQNRRQEAEDPRAIADRQVGGVVDHVQAVAERGLDVDGGPGEDEPVARTILRRTGELRPKPIRRDEHRLAFTGQPLGQHGLAAPGDPDHHGEDRQKFSTSGRLSTSTPQDLYRRRKIHRVHLPPSAAQVTSRYPHHRQASPGRGAKASNPGEPERKWRNPSNSASIASSLSASHATSTPHPGQRYSSLARATGRPKRRRRPRA